ncbi:uncharacterized protein BXZ73DRAFT_102625 [Epithele typhae]|uniref:uncharacterized protein n=1 Tax=Epithele typhae TaxID=378194 RepID=UPI002007BAF7|nr:uncharacterized protein BXZ73DRAFT_102625 [Epithele typhae]KAH9927492.1 hypothetical protein BXZ73DRAFT_102625 [Epithele typhae]
MPSTLPPWSISEDDPLAESGEDTVATPLTVRPPLSPPLPEWSAEEALAVRTLSPTALQTWASLEMDHHQRYIQKLRAVYNNAALIHRRLPPEVLMEIFARIRPQSRHAIHVLHVCRTWRSLVLRTAEFWVGMLALPSGLCDPTGPQASRTNARFLAGFLDLSSSRPITFDIQDFSFYMADILAPHCHRLRRLHLKVSSEHAERFFHMLSFGMPQLRHLTIHHNSAPHRSRPELARLLQLIDLQIPFAFTSIFLPLSSLCTLKLGGCKCDGCNGFEPGLMLDGVLSFLRQCPRLHVLHFLGKSIRRRQPPSPVSTELVELADLKNLLFDHTIVEWVSDVLAKLVLPLSTVIRLEVSPEGDGGMYLPAALRTLPARATYDHVDFDFHMDDAHFVSKVRCKSARQLRLSVIPRDARAEPAVRAARAAAVFAAFASPAVAALELYVSNSRIHAAHAMGPATLRAMLLGFPAVARLCVWRAGVRDLPAVLLLPDPAARERDGDAAAAAAVPEVVPRLRHLVVRWRPPRRSREDEVVAVVQELRNALAWRRSVGCGLESLELELRRLKKMERVPDLEEFRLELEQVWLQGAATHVTVSTYLEDWPSTARTGEGARGTLAAREFQAGLRVNLCLTLEFSMRPGRGRQGVGPIECPTKGSDPLPPRAIPNPKHPARRPSLPPRGRGLNEPKAPLLGARLRRNELATQTAVPASPKSPLFRAPAPGPHRRSTRAFDVPKLHWNAPALRPEA